MESSLALVSFVDVVAPNHSGMVGSEASLLRHGLPENDMSFASSAWNELAMGDVLKSVDADGSLLSRS